MNLEDYRAVFTTTGFVLMLVAASPVLSMVIPFSGRGERFSELWVLGPTHMMEDYPFNVKGNESYTVFLGIGNNMGGSEYYLVYVKFGNQTEPLPDNVDVTPSPLIPLYDYRVFLGEGETWEKNVTFSFSGVMVEDNACRVSYLIIGGSTFSVNKTTLWSIDNRGYYFRLFFELWRFNATADQFQFHNRYVNIWLNMTISL